MKKDLTTSTTNRQNILNNSYSNELKEFQTYLSDIGVGDISKIPSLGLFSFKLRIIESVWENN